MKMCKGVFVLLFVLSSVVIHSSCTSCAPSETDLMEGNQIIEQEGVFPVNE